jgi:hypothetical protein
MNPTEVVPSEMQGQGCFQILPFPAESICQPCEPANVHSHCEVLPFDVRRANSIEFWLSPSWERHNVHNLSRRVALLSVSRGSIDFNQLREVNTSPQAHVNRINVRPEAVCRDLEVALRGLVNLLGEGNRVTRREPDVNSSKFGA